MSDREDSSISDPGSARQIRNLKALLELSRAMAKEIELERLLPVIMEKTSEILDADRSTLFLYDATRNELWSIVAQGLDAREIRFSATEGLAGYVARNRETVNVGDPYSDARFNPEVDRRTTYRTNSLLCMPVLNNSDELVAVIEVLNKQDRDGFGLEDEELLDALAAHVGVALERAKLVASYAEQQRLRESLRVAREIQQSMLPEEQPAPSEKMPINVCARMIPAAEVGGDFYDYLEVEDEAFYFAIGDVSGKGVPAALLMAVTRNVLRSFMRAGLPPEECLRQANALLQPEYPPSMFVTVLVGCIHAESGILEYGIAGHFSPYLLKRADPTARLLERAAGIGLCLLPTFRYEARRLQLEPGDTVFLYTDGLTEALDRTGTMFGQDGIATCLGRAVDRSAAGLVTHAMASVEMFAAGTEQWDDQTTMAVQYCGNRR